MRHSSIYGNYFFSRSSSFFQKEMSLIYSKFVKDVYIVTEDLDFK